MTSINRSICPFWVNNWVQGLHQEDDKRSNEWQLWQFVEKFCGCSATSAGRAEKPRTFTQVKKRIWRSRAGRGCLLSAVARLAGCTAKFSEGWRQFRHCCVLIDILINYAQEVIIFSLFFFFFFKLTSSVFSILLYRRWSFVQTRGHEAALWSDWSSAVIFLHSSAPFRLDLPFKSSSLFSKQRRSSFVP